MSKYSGLKFKKFDLHVHTPASHDFKNKSVTPELIVKEAVNKELRGIAITDHNTGAWIDKIKEAAKGKNLAVFPGVEIHCSGGESGIHIIGIFDVEKGSEHVNALLASLEISADDFGKPDTVTHKSVYDVIDIISSKPHYGIAVLAHCKSSKGVLGEIKGEIRKKIFEHTGVLAVETSYEDFTNNQKIQKKNRAIDLLNGDDQNYNKRKLAVYISSDSRANSENTHTLEGIGTRYTYFKVDDVINLESLRQCFIDRDVRIRQYFEYKHNTFPNIKKVSVKGGYFDNQSAEFHNGFNSILGGKGAGKSLLIEFMRFALSKESTNLEILDDYNSKLEKRLDTYGEICIEFEDETGMEYKITRQYNPAQNNPYLKIDECNIANAYSALFLSQNEIIKIAEDHEEQIKFIDKFFDFQNFKDRIKNIESDLNNLDNQFAEGLRAISNINEIDDQMGKNVHELEKLKKLLSDPIYDKYKDLEQKDFAFKTQIESVNILRNDSSNVLESLNIFNNPEFEKPASEDPAIKRNTDIITQAISNVQLKFEEALNIIDKSIINIRNEYDQWLPNYNTEKGKYEKYIRQAGGDKKEIERKRIRLVLTIEDLKKRRALLEKKSKNLKNIKETRDGLITELLGIYGEYSRERKEKCNKFQKESNRRLKIELHESTNIDAFRESLLNLKRGSHLKDAEIDIICQNIKPYDFILHILRYDASKKVEHIQPISEQTNINNSRVKVLCDFLLSSELYEDLLKLQYKVHPQDKPIIQYKLNDGSYEEIKNISVGQKCTAMLIMALSEGSFPIIIDQPEDSLDVRSVWDDMCVKIRKGKTERQFIFTTHNSSLAVASDTDKFTLIENVRNKGEIYLTGAIDINEVKEEVIKYLEGGRITYKAKAQKYNLKR